MKLSKITYTILLFLNVGCFSPQADQSVPSINWPAVFSTTKADEAAGFQVYNPAGLNIPQEGTSYHQQGIQQLSDGGWVVSGSGQEKGYLYFTAADGVIHTVLTMPDDLRISGPGASLKYNHPGGFQLTDHILAVGLENTDHRRDSYSRVVLLDISDPGSPEHYSHLDIIREAEAGRVMTAGAVAITEMEDSYLIVVGNWDSGRLDFYETSSKDLADKKTTVSDCLGSWTPGSEGRSYQNINAYGASPEALYLVGMYSVDRREDRADLLQLNVVDWDNIQLIQKQEKTFAGGTEAPKFVHASGTTFDPESQRFRVYSVEADAEQDTIVGNIWIEKNRKN